MLRSEEDGLVEGEDVFTLLQAMSIRTNLLTRRILRDATCNCARLLHCFVQRANGGLQFVWTPVRSAGHKILVAHGDLTGLHVDEYVVWTGSGTFDSCPSSTGHNARDGVVLI
jgi:hypothetical protein